MPKQIGHTIDQIVDEIKDEKAILKSKRAMDKKKGSFHLVPGFPGNLQVFVPAGKSVKKAIEKFTKLYQNRYADTFKKGFVD
jgi:hypothetical protein